MIIRLRTKVGMWRYECLATTMFSEFINMVEQERHLNVIKIGESPSSLKIVLDYDSSMSLEDMGLSHGSILHAELSGFTESVDDSLAVPGSSNSKVIDLHGNVVPGRADNSKNGFRPGLQALRTQKLHWTLTDMVAFDKKYTFELKGDQIASCSSASCEKHALDSFQAYLREFAFQRPRCAYLFGKFVPSDEISGGEAEVEKKATTSSNSKIGVKRKMNLSDLDEIIKSEKKPQQGVVVQTVYEPLQDMVSGEFHLLEDPVEDKVDSVARALGMVKVGFMFSHPPGRTGYTLSTNEIVNAAEQALEAAEEKPDFPFIVLVCTAQQPPEGGSLMSEFHAFSLTRQCLDMVAEDVLLIMPKNPGHSAVRESFKLIVEKKEALVVDNDFFIKRVPIVMHEESPYTGSGKIFPRSNRDPANSTDSKNALRTILKQIGSQPTDADIARALSDFDLLVYLSGHFAIGEEIAEIAAFVASHNTPGVTPIPLEEGYKAVIFHIAGLEISQ